MVIELIAARFLAPYIGVSLYTWTSIIGVILAGIAIGNYIGGKIADRYPHPSILTSIFLVGSLATICILPFGRMVATADWFSELPLMLNYSLTTVCIFFIPAVILSMVSPLVIKLSLPDVKKTGGVVGTVYAFSTAGAILGTFATGFYLILWFGIQSIIWLVAVILIVTGILAWFAWKIPNRWKATAVNAATWGIAGVVIISSIVAFQFRGAWQEDYTVESNYYTIKVEDSGTMKMLILDHLVHSFVNVNDPTAIVYGYQKNFIERVSYYMRDNPAPRILHMGGGGYTFPRYLEALYPEVVNEVIEIDPEVTRITYSELGLSPDTSIVTYNEDARRFLMKRGSREKYDIIVGDVFNDVSTPYHLTTVEFQQLVKSNLSENGIYMINIIDDFQKGRYMPSVILTLQQVFEHVTLFAPTEGYTVLRLGTFVVVASDKEFDSDDYFTFLKETGINIPAGTPYSEAVLHDYLSTRDPILLTDDYAPTDILVAPTIEFRLKTQNYQY